LDKLTNNKRITSIKTVKEAISTGKNFFASKEPVGDFWTFTGTSYEGKDTQWGNDIQSQIRRVEEETEGYKNILANPYGQNLNLIG